MTLFVVYCRNKKKFEKYIKVNKIKNKYIIDLRKIIEEEEIVSGDKMFLKILIFNKIQSAIEKNKDIYYIPDFEEEDFKIDKLLNLKKILENNNFNVLIFYNEFKKFPHIIDNILENLSKFNGSQIIKDY